MVLFIRGFKFLALIMPFISAFAYAGETMSALSRRSDAELVLLLTDRDTKVRQLAAIALGRRYQNPKADEVLSHYPPADTLPPEARVPDGVVCGLARVMNNDAELKVRLSALIAVHCLRFRTNTSPLIVNLLTDKTLAVRLRAADTLVSIAHEYREELPKGVLPTLIQCLATSESEEVIWQAAYSLGRIGPPAREAVVALEKLKNHKSKKVRKYASEALLKIGRATTHG